MSFSCSPFRQLDDQGRLGGLTFHIESRSDLDRVTLIGPEHLDDRFSLLDRYVTALQGTNIGLFVTMADFFTNTYTSLFGFENFMYLLADDRDLIEEVLEIHVNFQVAVAKRVREIKKRYGRDLTLVGNMDVGGALSTGSMERVAEEARQLIDDVGQGGGYVLASCHSITSNVRPENFLAMVHTAQQYGRY